MNLEPSSNLPCKFFGTSDDEAIFAIGQDAFEETLGVIAEYESVVLTSGRSVRLYRPDDEADLQVGSIGTIVRDADGAFGVDVGGYVFHVDSRNLSAFHVFRCTVEQFKRAIGLHDASQFDQPAEPSEGFAVVDQNGNNVGTDITDGCTIRMTDDHGRVKVTLRDGEVEIAPENIAECDDMLAFSELASMKVAS
jgi:hypothetical protein